MISSKKTYLACLTPAATGAIATLALHGPSAWTILEELFEPVGTTTPCDFFAKLRQDAPTERFWLGKFGEAERGRDDIVLALKSAEPVPSFEIHCHGGLQVVALLEECLVARGAEKCSWQELLAQITGDRIKVAAQAALSEALTARTASIMLDQYHGAFSRAIDDVLLDLEHGRTAQGTQKLQELARWIPLGKHLTTPWRIAIAGAPNVGKSTLINRLAGYQRCIVSATPGTTRDAVTTLIALDGWPLELIDTAGIREQAEALEQEGIDLALDTMTSADLCLWLVDASTAPTWPPHNLPHQRTIINKIDLPAAWKLEDAPQALRISAQTGAGVEEMCDVIINRLIPQIPPAGAAVPFTAALCRQVEESLQKCQEGNWGQAVHVLRNDFLQTSNDEIRMTE